ncbi:hypothetical protein [Kitasatospora sp. CB01950]|uniref:hypothetical protein n=1 Tax=Kitasatospora sp. CB01950 TaxID=1703930 RepID=UPI00093A90E3|nr:hypothetical protein [Kitasatospora sp. CB01950]
MSIRRRRNRLAVLAATVVLGATVPVLGGATNAWADCGDTAPAAAAAAPASAPALSAPASAPASSAPASAPASSPAASAPAATPKPELAMWIEGDKVTAGGAPLVFGVQIRNTGTGTLKGAVPFPTFYNEAGAGLPGVLQPEDLVLEVLHQGEWKTIALKPGCDPVLRGDYSFLATDVEPGGATRVQFRLSVTSHSNAAQKQVDIRVGLQNMTADLPFIPHFTAPIVHPGAPSSPAPTAGTGTPSTPPATPSTSAGPSASAGPVQSSGPAVVPAGYIESTPGSTPVGTENLASTGGGSDATPLLIGGTALVLLGAGAVTLSARRRSAHRG